MEIIAALITSYMFILAVLVIHANQGIEGGRRPGLNRRRSECTHIFRTYGGHATVCTKCYQQKFFSKEVY